MKIAVTGHRPSKLGDAYDLHHSTNITIGQNMRAFILQKAGYQEKTNSFLSDEKVTLISGMALGVDTIWALVALKLKERYPTKFELECAIPCAKHSSRWKKVDQDRHADIMARADIVTMVSEDAYAPYLMQKRNEYMVDKADILLAVWDGTKGGTGNCVKYAMKTGRTTYQYHPFVQEELILLENAS